MFETSITSNKVAEDSVIRVGWVINWIKLKVEQKFNKAWHAGSPVFKTLQFKSPNMYIGLLISKADTRVRLKSVSKQFKGAFGGL